MNERKAMNAACPVALGLATMLVAVQAHGQGQRSDADTLRSSVQEVLSLTTFGAVAVRDEPADVVRDGADFRLRLPLDGFSTPADASVETVARPSSGGAWDITSMTVPSAGTVGAGSPDTRITYTLGEQSIHARVDPGFAQPSSFAARVAGVRLHFEQDGSHSDQTFERYDADGALSGETAGRVTFASASKGANWHVIAQAPDGMRTDSVVKTLEGHVTVEGLDRAQGARLVAAGRALVASARQAMPSAPDDQPPGTGVAQRQVLRDVVDAMTGLLGRFEAEQTLDGVSLSFGLATRGAIGRVHVDVAGNALDDRLSARMGFALDEIALASMSPEATVYVPHHVDLKSALAGVRISRLMTLLRAATEADADLVGLQDQMMRLFDEPGARVGIESIDFDSGPVRVTGSARVVPDADGHASAAIHLSATGVDALLTQAQTSPVLQQALPVMLMAKGMGRAEGGAVVWDITMGDGPLTINGVPFGQPAPRTR